MRLILLLSALTLGLGFLTPDSVASEDGVRGAIAGVVVDSNGKPVPGAKVTIDNGKGFTATMRTNKRGRFGLAGLRSGLYSVKAGKRGVGKDRTPTLVRPNQTTFVRLKL